MHVAMGPVSSGDANTIIMQMANLKIGYDKIPGEDKLVTIVTNVACSTCDQATLINLAVQLSIPVQLLTAEQAADMVAPVEPEEKPEEKPADEGHSVVFLGIAVKGGFASAEEAKEYIEAVLGADAMDRLGISVA